MKNNDERTRETVDSKTGVGEVQRPDKRAKLGYRENFSFPACTHRDISTYQLKNMQRTKKKRQRERCRMGKRGN